MASCCIAEFGRQLDWAQRLRLGYKQRSGPEVSRSGRDPPRDGPRAPVPRRTVDRVERRRPGCAEIAAELIDERELQGWFGRPRLDAGGDAGVVRGLREIAASRCRPAGRELML